MAEGRRRILNRYRVTMPGTYRARTLRKFDRNIFRAGMPWADRVLETVPYCWLCPARAPLAIRGTPLPRADLRGIRFTDSRTDAQVQVADILAGVGREVARLAATGRFDDPLQTVVHQMLDFNVMSSGGSPVDRLVERAPLKYLEERREQVDVAPRS